MQEFSPATENTRTFTISSAAASETFNGTKKSNCTFQLNNFIDRRENTESIYFSVLSATVPNSLYNVNIYNNKLVISGVLYTIPIGHYNATTLAKALNILFDGLFTMTYSKITGKYSIVSVNDFTIDSATTAYRLIGQVANTQLSSTNSILEFPHQVNFITTPRLIFRTNALELENLHNDDYSNNVFLALQNNVQQGGMIFFKNDQQTRYLVEVENANSIDIRITDETNNAVDFNNQDWYLTFQIQYFYKHYRPKISFRNIMDNNGKMLYTEYYANSEENNVA